MTDIDVGDGRVSLASEDRDTVRMTILGDDLSQTVVHMSVQELNTLGYYLTGYASRCRRGRGRARE